MAKGVTTCDWLKRQLEEDEECIEVMIDGEEFTFSPDGHNAFMSFLRGNAPLATAVGAQPVVVEDLKTPPPVTREQTQQVLEESKVAEEGSLPVMSDAEKRRRAQERLNEFNQRHEHTQSKEAKSAGSEHYRNIS